MTAVQERALAPVMDLLDEMMDTLAGDQDRLELAIERVAATIEREMRRTPLHVHRWGLERWPLVDLLEAVAIDPHGPRWAAEASLRFGVTRRTVHRWRHDGMTTAAADDAAVRSGLHPVLIWAGWDDA